MNRHGEHHAANTITAGAACPVRPSILDMFTQEEAGPGSEPSCLPCDENVGKAEGGEEAQMPRPRKAPSSPSAEEVAAHRMTGHAVYRSWCRDCVQGRGRNAPHRATLVRNEPELPVISFDYGFLGAKEQGQDATCEREGHAPVLVYHDSHSNGIYGHLVPHKGVDYPEIRLVIEAVCKNLDNLGYKRVAFRSDGEPAILAFLGAIKRAWDGEVVPEQSPPGESQSNGAAEKAVQTSKAILRSVKFGLESNLGGSIPNDHPLISWMLRQSTACQRRFAVGHNGKTAFENVYGRKPQSQVVEFGEKIWWRPLQTEKNRLGSLDHRFEEGFYLGPIDGTTSVVVATLSGSIVQSRALKRRPAEERWDREGLLKISAWDIQPNGAESEDRRIKIRAPVYTDRIPEDQLPRRFDADPEVGPKRVYMARRDFHPAKFGYTEHCLGCTNIRRGGAHSVGHSERCRARVQELMKQDPASAARLERAEERITEAIASKIECQEEHGHGTIPTPGGSGKTRMRRTEPVSRPQKRARISQSADDKHAQESGVPDGAGHTAMTTVQNNHVTVSSPGPASEQLVSEPAEMETDASNVGDGDIRMAAIEEEPDSNMMLIYTNEDSILPWVVPLEATYGAKSGYSLQPSLGDADGSLCDFDKRSNRAKARRLIREKRPALLVCSLAGHDRIGEAKCQRALAKGRRQFRFVIELCQEQMRHGGYFLFEHPASASSWREPEMIKFLKQPAVRNVVGNMCRFGMETSFEDGSLGPVSKATMFATNSEHLSRNLVKKCMGVGTTSVSFEESKDHAQAHLLNRRAAAATLYPPELGNAIVVGMRCQLREDQ